MIKREMKRFLYNTLSIKDMHYACKIEHFKKWLRVCIKTEKLFFFVVKSAEIHEPPGAPPPLLYPGLVLYPHPHQRRNFAYT